MGGVGRMAASVSVECSPSVMIEKGLGEWQLPIAQALPMGLPSVVPVSPSCAPLKVSVHVFRVSFTDKVTLAIPSVGGSFVLGLGIPEAGIF